MAFPFKWRLYYVDGTTFDNFNGEPWESPVRPRIICIAQPGATQYNPILVSETWFAYHADINEWASYETEGDMLDTIQEDLPAIKCVRKGKWIQNPLFRELWDRAREEAGMHS